MTATAFAVVKVLEYRGVIGGGAGADYERLRREYQLPTYTIEQIVDRVRNMGLLFRPEVGCILISGIIEDDRGTALFDLQAARGGRTRYLVARDGEFEWGLVSDGQRVWDIRPEGVAEITEQREMMLVRAEYEPLFVSADERGHRVESIEHRGRWGEDGLWVVVTARDGSRVEYQVSLTGILPIQRRVWTMKGPGGETIVEDLRFEGIYLISRGQTIFPVQHMVVQVGEERSTSTARMLRCGIAGAPRDDYFRPEGLDVDLWEHMPPPANLQRPGG